MVTVILVSLGLFLLGIVLGFFSRKFIAEAKIQSAEQEAKKILEAAHERVEAEKRSVLVEAKEEIYKLRAAAENEVAERRLELTKLENRLGQREEILDQKESAITKKEQALTEKEKQLELSKAELEALKNEQRKRLEELAGLSSEEAKKLLLKNIEVEARQDAGALIKRIEAEAKEEAERKARSIVALSIQRCAAEQVTETTVSVVNIPNDDMKGRIIGREGRNIRAFETLTGINIIIDDTPGAVILSSFDPVRREVARRTLEKLILDGRIHPARIEEMFEKAKAEVEAEIKAVGEEAVHEVNVRNIHPELVKVLGRLKYRTSYGQNVLQHSLEVAHLAGIMAAELGADVQLAKRAGLLHDIGKAIDHEVEGSHAAIGADLAKRLNEAAVVSHPIEAHHAEVEPRTIEAVLVQSADAISAARPGARRESLESYVKRLEKLEALAEAYKGVEKSYAMQAGREIRVMVKPDEVTDEEAALLAREIAKEIETQLEYPGQIKVTVIRENRATEYAK